MSDLSRSAARGGAITLLTQGAKVGLQAGNLVVLSRLLTPSDFGLVAMVVAIVGVGEVLRDFGLSSAAVQAKTLSRGQRSNLFWVNSGLGLFLAATFALLSGPLARLYGDGRLGPIAVALASILLLNGLQTQFQAELTRELRFVSLSLTELGTALAGLGLAIALALNGFGYWAIVVQQVVGASLLLVARVVLCRWRPGFPQRDASIREFLSFGSNLAGTQLLVYASANVGNFLIGLRTGPAELGLYTRAYGVLSVPLNQLFAPITAVALPVLSRLQDDDDQFTRYVLRAQVVLGYASSLLLAVAAVGAPQIVHIVLGDAWGAAVPLLTVLCVGGIFQAINYPLYWIFLAKGLTGSHLRYSLISRSLVIGLIVVGSSWGAFGVAIAYSVSMAVTWPMALLWLGRQNVTGIAALFRGGLRVLTLSLFAILSASALLLLFGIADLPALVGLILAFLTVVAGHALGLLLPRYRRDLLEIRSTVAALGRSPVSGGPNP